MGEKSGAASGGEAQCAAAAIARERADEILAHLPLIEAGAADGRNFVKKAANWALRQIGKRSAALNDAAVALARQLRESESPSARWVGSDAYRELTSPAVRSRLGIQ